MTTLHTHTHTHTQEKVTQAHDSYLPTTDRLLILCQSFTIQTGEGNGCIGVA